MPVNAYVLSGYVFDSDYYPLDVKVGIEDEFGATYTLTTTDQKGYFEFPDVNGQYAIFVNDDDPILWEYTGAGIGYYASMLDVTSDLEVNFTLLRTWVSFVTNTSEYHNGDMIEVELTVENNDVYDLINWEAWAELVFWNATPTVYLDDDAFFIDINSSETASYLLYLQIPKTNEYDYLSLNAGIWAYGMEFESSIGLLEGEMWNWYGIEISVDRNTTFNLALSKGWNLISIPLVLANNSAEHVFSPVDYSSLYYYNSEYEIWEVPTQIKNTQAYWIELNTTDTLIVEGIYPWETFITLYEGWNLIGYPSLQDISVLDFLGNHTAYSYDGFWSGYIPGRTFNSLQTLKPGFGYWVKVE